MFDLDEETRWILGRPNFACARIAHALIGIGEIKPLPPKAEEEQAAVIYWMLKMYEQHGKSWRARAGEVLCRPIPSAGKSP